MRTPLPVTRVPAKVPPILPRQRRATMRDMQRRSCGWEHPEIRELLHGRRDLGPEPVEQLFGDDQLGIIPARTIHPLEHLVIATGERDAIIEQTDEGNVLTGCYRSENDCRLIFRHAYATIRCTVRTLCDATDVHLAFLNCLLQEMQTFNIQRPRSSRNDASGSLCTTFEFHAEPLYELQGIAWRGGMLQISKISLIP
ncbi:hypothetical protein SAMN02800692_0761 [Luteibacter sp. UNC138MFCol5.1]|nr:hypothetical protein SAMN02800692_0761 [Luteibacter sp. UNC138MFCol5.1]